MSVIAPELVTAILDRAPVGRLVLCDLGDRPQGLPFVFARVDDAIYSPIDGKPKRRAELSRLAWIERRPEASVIVDHYEADWSRLWFLSIPTCAGRRPGCPSASTLPRLSAG